MKLWMVQRAKALHRMCQGIALDISSDVAKGRAYSRGRRRFNHTKIAKLRGMNLCLSAVRGHYARWKENPTVECFEARWGLLQAPIIGVSFRRELALRAIEMRVTANGLYSRLKTEVPNLSFSRDTLLRSLPCDALRVVSNAQRALNLAVTIALKETEAIEAPESNK